MLYLALIPGEYVGWGVCSRYLIQEVGQLIEITAIGLDDVSDYQDGYIDGKVFHTIGDHNLTKVFNITGRQNCGYTFFENLLPEHALANARSFDMVLAGSTWCRDRLREKGITWSDVLIQGIDPQLFFPLEGPKPGAGDYFVIFSGGKFELRKGQDIVIRAAAVMQQRHKDVLFVNCWHNAWPFSLNSMARSRLIDFQKQAKWDVDYLQKLMAENNIDLERTEILPRVSQDQLRKIYACTDIGLFPNRCEGGTNLVLMEYMACGKPVIASYNSGHKDILTDKNSLCLNKMSPFEIRDDQGNTSALWEDPDLEEVIESLEYAYQNREALKALGRRAGKDLAKRTWRHTARDLLDKINRGSGFKVQGSGLEGRQVNIEP